MRAHAAIARSPSRPRPRRSRTQSCDARAASAGPNGRAWAAGKSASWGCELLRHAGSTQPLVQDEARQQEALSVLDRPAERRGRSAGPRQRVDQDLRVEDDHSRPPPERRPPGRDARDAAPRAPGRPRSRPGAGWPAPGGRRPRAGAASRARSASPRGRRSPGSPRGTTWLFGRAAPFCASRAQPRDRGCVERERHLGRCHTKAILPYRPEEGRGGTGRRGRDVPQRAAGDRADHAEDRHPPHDARREEPRPPLADEGLDVLRPRRSRGRGGHPATAVRGSMPRNVPATKAGEARRSRP